MFFGSYLTSKMCLFFLFLKDNNNVYMGFLWVLYYLAWHIIYAQQSYICYANNIIYIIYKLKLKWQSLSCVWLFVIPWTIQSINSPGQNTGVSSLSFLKGILPTQGSNPGLLHCRRTFLPAETPGSPHNIYVNTYIVVATCSRKQTHSEGQCR